MHVGASSLMISSLENFQPLNPAEARVVAELASGNFERLGDGVRPEWDDPDRIVRAEFLRFLILGGDAGARIHEKGLRLSGARIIGKLDLEGCRVPRDIGLKDCLFDTSPALQSAIIDNLYVDGSALPGFQADGLEARGGLFFRGATVTGQVSLRGARIGASIETDGAIITATDENAIDADGLEARGGILLRGAQITGGVNLSGARLGGDVNAIGTKIHWPDAAALNCDGMTARGDILLRGATITGEVRMLGGHFDGDFDCTSATFAQPGGYALRLNRATIDGAFFLRQDAVVQGILDLTATLIGAIDDDRRSWPQPNALLLNRCRYGAFIGGPVDAQSRLDWLARQVPEDFWPQPYEHLSSVLREMGHNEDATAVLIAKKKLQRRARRERAKSQLLRFALAVSDGVLAVTLRYGRQPLFALLWLILFWAVGVVVFGFGERNSAMKPNSAVVLRSLEWTMCNLPQTQHRYMPTVGQVLAGRAQPGQTQLTCFLSQPEASSYPEFNSFMYSLDVLLPVLEIGQKAHWRPDPSKPNGSFTLYYYFFQSVVGWALSLLAVAGFSGLVKSR